MAEHTLTKEADVPASAIYSTLFEHEVEAGKSILYGSIAPENILLQEEVPAGKVWTVKVHLMVSEEDA